jgi:hypothetical protein
MTAFNPYRSFLRNSRVRRLYLITVIPPLALLSIPAFAVAGVWDGLKDTLLTAFKAFKDPINYD